MKPYTPMTLNRDESSLKPQIRPITLNQNSLNREPQPYIYHPKPKCPKSQALIPTLMTLKQNVPNPKPYNPYTYDPKPKYIPAKGAL